MIAVVRDPWRRLTLLAAGLVVSGLVGLGIAWSGAADTWSVPAQVSFALSGGFGGLALAGSGLALLDIQARRYAAAEERSDVAALHRELANVAELIAARRAATPAAAAAGVTARRRRSRALRAR